MLSSLIALHFVVALVGLGAHRLGPRAFLIAAVAPLATVVWAIASAPSIGDGEAHAELWRWAPQLGLDVALRVDRFALVMVLLVSAVGTLVFGYAWRYFRDATGLGGLVANLAGFSGAMLGVVVSDNLIVLFVFWELTSVTSYLLIGHDHRAADASAAARQALLITVTGGLAMLAGFVILAQQAGTYRLTGLVDAPPSGGSTTVAMILVLVGAFTKSAQVPFHSWLPRAMVAPTPVSAYLHSATMVTAGVFLIARMAPVLSGSGGWRPLVVSVGSATMLVGAGRALRQFDLKLLLAYGTISQLGLMTALFGINTPASVVAGVAVLVAQAVFKAALFMVTGIIDHQAGTRDLRRLAGLRAAMPGVFVVAVVAAASMAGLPPLLGFAAKESVFDALTHGPLDLGGWFTLVAIAAGSALTVAYSGRFLWGAFGRQGGLPVDRPDRLLVAPAAVLAILSLGAAHVDALTVGGARALVDVAADVHVAVWHGVGAPLAVSALSIAAGFALFAARGAVERIQARSPHPIESDRVYRRLVDGIGSLSDRVTGVVQPGSLPVYLGAILFTALALPMPSLVASLDGAGSDAVLGPPLQIAIALIVVGATVELVRSERRFAAVIFLGAVGYGVAGLFMVQGAPDLALTQLLVETLTLVLFVLVLRHLPEQFRRVPWRLTQPVRVAIAGSVGVFVAGFAVVAASARRASPVSTEHLARAYSEGGGRNVVNVILVDFRGFDTLGEVTVVMVATLGIIGLVRAARRERLSQPMENGPVMARTPGFRPSPILDAGVRALAPTLAVFSMFLLFAGHNHPGGGFIGGLVGGSALVLLHVRGGDVRLRGHGAITAEKLVGAGIALAAGVGTASLVAGGEFLESGTWSADVPLLGEIKASSALAFDAGVYLVVVGLVLGILRSLGRERMEPT